MDCMLLTFEKNSSAYALGGVSGKAYISTTDEQLQKNRGCFFPVQAMLPRGFASVPAMLPRDFPFHQFIIINIINEYYLPQSTLQSSAAAYRSQFYHILYTIYLHNCLSCLIKYH